MIHLLLAAVLSQANCNHSTVGFTPLTDFQSGESYLGLFAGGLYPDGRNSPPRDHAREGIRSSRKVFPRGPNGVSDPENGKIVLLSIGMSNTHQEWCGCHANGGACEGEPCNEWTAMPQIQALAGPSVVVVNGARGGHAALDWINNTNGIWEWVEDELAAKGVFPRQVQSMWVKLANKQPTIPMPAQDSDAAVLMARLAEVLRVAKARYPHLQQCFISSRTYGGYAAGTLNPEPYAYESGFSVKWLIAHQIDQLAGEPPDPNVGFLGLGMAPWIAWGPYLWADGVEPRSDGLVWLCEDVNPNDGIHPSFTGWLDQ
jgi:hypothetical protein